MCLGNCTCESECAECQCELIESSETGDTLSVDGYIYLSTYGDEWFDYE